MTLFSPSAIIISHFKNEYKLDISEAFIACADKQLTPLFKQLTGLRVAKNVCLSFMRKERFQYEKGDVSSLSFSLSVNHNWNDFSISWKSHSGAVYDIAHTNIDCTDIVFSFENLDPALYVQQLYPKIKLPFKIAHLTYELKLLRINIDTDFTLTLKDDCSIEQDNIIMQIDEFIQAFNDQSIKKDRSEGVVHRARHTIINKKNLSCAMDLGSTGFGFLKKFLQFLSDLNVFAVVEIG